MRDDTNNSSGTTADEALMGQLVPWVRQETRWSALAALTLPDCLDELISWLRHQRIDSWQRAFQSLLLDLDASIAVLGPELRTSLSPVLGSFREALVELGRKATAEKREEVAAEGAAVLARAVTPSSRRAAWRDLVGAVRAGNRQDDAAQLNALLYGLLRHASVDTDWRQPHFASILEDNVFGVGNARGDDWDGVEPTALAGATPSERLRLCEELAGRMPRRGRCVVWLAFEHARLERILEELGPVMLVEARWAIPNAARPDGQRFPHRDELANSDDMRIGLVTDPMIADDLRVVLARIDLGERETTGAMKDARKIVDTLVDVAAFHGNGARWTFHGWSILLVDGRQAMSSLGGRDNDPTGTIYDLDHTAAALSERGGMLASAMASRPLPPDLDEALRSRTVAEGADDRTKLIMADRVVEMVAAHARREGVDLAADIARTWPQARLRAVIGNAFELALSAGTTSDERRTEANRLRKAVQTSVRPGMFTTDFGKMASHVGELEALAAGTDAEAGARALLNLTDPAMCDRTLASLDADADLLAHRLRRVRNALTHGNPATPTAIGSVARFATYLADYALDRALDAFASGGSLEDRVRRDVAAEAALRTELRAGVRYVDTLKG